MPESKDMHLDSWGFREGGMIREFIEFWRSRNNLEPENYPMMMEREEWDDQFNAFKETKYREEVRTDETFNRVMDEIKKDDAELENNQILDEEEEFKSDEVQLSI